MENFCSRCGKTERRPGDSYCRECRNLYARDRARSRSSSWGQPKTCSTCERVFVPQRSQHQRWCSSTCKRLFRSHGIARPDRKPCDFCGAWFEVPEAGLVRACCSERCRLRVRTIKSHGLSVKRFKELLASQDGKCAACLVTFGDIRRVDLPCIDHDHSCCSGTSCGDCVRGLLCFKCNVTAGSAGDNPQTLRRLATYIETCAA